jgi:hypothetical protein
MPKDADRDEYDLAKREAIEEASEKEYLNAILAALQFHSNRLERFLFIISVELAVLVAVVLLQILL